MRSTAPARRMSARSVARLTDTLLTPSTLARAASTRPTQLAQVMPSMGRLIAAAAARAALVVGVLMVCFSWLEFNMKGAYGLPSWEGQAHFHRYCLVRKRLGAERKKGVSGAAQGLDLPTVGSDTVSPSIHSRSFHEGQQVQPLVHRGSAGGRRRPD